MAERLPMRVPENPKTIIRYQDRVWYLACRRENLHHVRKWARRATRNLRGAGFRHEAMVFDWLWERTRVGLAHHPQEGPLSFEERLATARAVELYAGISIRAFDLLLAREVARGHPFRRWMLARGVCLPPSAGGV